MPTYHLQGIPVEFPHEAYACQLAFMGHVLAALTRAEHALLESPTGTGKTLSLLCAALAWRTAHVARHQLSGIGGVMEGGEGGEIGGAGAGAGTHNVLRLKSALAAAVGPTAPTASTASMASTASTRIHTQTPTEKAPLIVYASRTHSQLAQVVRELRRTSYRVRVAVVGSREQLCVHPDVRRLPGSMQATVCQRLVRRKACEFFGHVAEGVDHVAQCARTRPDDIPDLEDVARLAAQHRACAYFVSREGVGEADVVLLPYNYLLDRKTMGATLLDLRNAVVIFDEAHNVEGSCGDAVSCEVSTEDLAQAVAELRVCRELLDSAFFAGSLAGARVTSDAVACATRFADALRRLLLDAARFPATPFFAAPGDGVFALFAEAGMDEAHVDATVAAFDDISRMFLEHQYNLRSGKRSALHALVNALRTIYGLAGRRPFEDSDAEGDTDVGAVTGAVRAISAGTGATSAGTGADTQLPIGDHLRSVKQSARAYYRMVISESSAPRRPGTGTGTGTGTGAGTGTGSNSVVRTLSYWCFNPGVVMRELVDTLGVRSIILTSGTLSPLQSFMHEMQIPFQHVLENEHVIEDAQVLAAVVPSGPTGRALNASYGQRDSAEYQRELGLAIANFCRVIPDGVLVFFPSYQVMDACIGHWQQTRLPGAAQTLFQMITAHKPAVSEPKVKHDLPEAMARYARLLDAPASTGAVFFAVCRGKVSEGLDFSDAKCRAVIITGIPYPPYKDPKIVLKKQYLQEQLSAKHPAQGQALFLSGPEWYNQQALRAVNQALGRVIRHRHDFGAVLLCDDRFAAPSVIAQLSKWLRGRVVRAAGFGEAQGALARFFKDKPKTAPAGPPDQPQLHAPANGTKLQEMAGFVPDCRFGAVGGSATDRPAPAPVPNPGPAMPSSLASFFKKPKLDDSSSSAKPPAAQKDPGKQLQAQQYLLSAKTILAPANCDAFLVMLKAFRADALSFPQLLAQFRALLEQDASAHRKAEDVAELWRGFRIFVPSKYKDEYDASPGPVMKENKDGNGAGHPASDESCAPTCAAIPAAEPAICLICKDPAETPQRAKCGHICCKGCWAEWLQRLLQCPLCRARTRIAQLRDVVPGCPSS